MSRDFKPFEQFLIDRKFKNNMRNSAITFTNKDGEEVRVDNHIAKERYPELSFLLNGFDNLYKYYESNKNALTVLDNIEDCLKKAEGDFMKGQYESDSETERVTKDWFNGRLDEKFYYAERNNELFYEFIEEQIAKEKEGEYLK